MAEEDHAPAPRLNCVGHDLRGDPRLPSADRDLDAGIGLLLPQMPVGRKHGVPLVVPKLRHCSRLSESSCAACFHCCSLSGRSRCGLARVRAPVVLFLLDDDVHLASWNRIEHLDVEYLHLRVVPHRACVYKRVLKALHAVVRIAPPPVGRIEVDRECEFALDWLDSAQARNRHHPITSALAAYQHTRAYVPVVAVHAGRVAKRELVARHHGFSPAPVGALD